MIQLYNFPLHRGLQCYNGMVNKQLYNDILNEETLPYCIHCCAYQNIIVQLFVNHAIVTLEAAM